MILKVPTAIFRLAVYLVIWQCFAAASRHRFADDHEVLATTNQGVVRGISVHKDVNAYLGIPFAQPPIGSLRFMPPQPLTNASLSESGKHIYNATKFGPVCYQFHYRTVMGDALAETSGQSEDCLTLNIFVPKRSHSACSPRKKPLPVFVWSFGGAFGEGGGSMPMFNPTNFVAENKDIIVVTWNYRTTLFGFPNSPALDYQNLGIRDQRIALEWVRDNISGFGGDPGRIVLGGHSSGADSGNAMLYSHADDPIAVAVAFQSGSVQVIGPSLHDHDLDFVRVAEAVGCADATNRTRELECMRRVDAKNLHLAISNRTLNTFGSLPGGAPMVDNVTLFTVQEYDRRGRAGKFAQLPTLIGGLEDEGDGISNWSEKCGINKTNSDIISAVVLNCNIALETKYRYMNDVPTWRYRYMGVFPEVTPYKWLGAYHESDVAMLMGTYNTINNTRSPGQTTTAAASRYYQQLFGTFIRNPATGLQDVYGWPTFNPNRKTLVQLFHKNALGAQLINPHRYDDICSHPPPLSWEAVAAPPPSC